MAIIRPHIQDGSTVWQFIRLSGTVLPQQDQVEIIERPGIDGTAARLNAKKAPEVRWRAMVDVVSTLDVYNLTNAMRALQGKLVSIRTEIGNTYHNVLVVQAQPRGGRRINTAVGGLQHTAAGYMFECDFLFKFTQV